MLPSILFYLVILPFYLFFDFICFLSSFLFLISFLYLLPFFSPCYPSFLFNPFLPSLLYFLFFVSFSSFPSPCYPSLPSFSSFLALLSSLSFFPFLSSFLFFISFLSFHPSLFLPLLPSWCFPFFLSSFFPALLSFFLCFPSFLVSFSNFSSFFASAFPSDQLANRKEIKYQTSFTLRSGTLPTPLVVGLGAACNIAQQEMAYDHEWVSKLSQKLVDSITSRTSHVVRNGDPEHSYPGCVNLSFAYVEGGSETERKTKGHILNISVAECAYFWRLS